MERAAALELLKSHAADDRLRAARTLAHNGELQDVPVLQATLSAETNRWTRSALQKAIALLSQGTSQTPVQVGLDGGDEENRMMDQIHAAAIEETTQRLVHEIQPILGRLKVHASQEIHDYELSKTSVEATRLEQLITAIDSLRQAAATPVYKEFDLATLVDQIIRSENATGTVKVQQAGPKPLMVLGSAHLVGLIVGNALRNAIEASTTVTSAEPVVVNWGSTDCDHWVAVLDRGPGLPVGSHKVFEMCSTSKKGHLGMGLALAKQAAQSLNGSLELAPRSPSGARFEFRWPHVRR